MLVMAVLVLASGCPLFNAPPKGDRAPREGRNPAQDEDRPGHEEEEPPPAYARLKNPVPADAESIARGRQLYNSYCSSCHGANGDGRGPAAVGLNPRPADFTDPNHMKKMNDNALFWKTSEGVEGTAMPAWKHQLDEDDRWHLVNYIRSFTTTTSGLSSTDRMGK